MKKLGLGLLLGAALPVAAHAADTYTIDPAHTYPNFTINHLGFSTMHGRFDSTRGTITLDTAKKTGKVDITIKTASISTGFAKRDADLRAPDFFNAAEYPTMTYKADHIRFKGNTPAVVEGKLPLLGVTRPVKLYINAFKCGVNPLSKKQECGAGATAEIKRSDFGMKTFLPAIGDTIKMDFEIEADKS